MVVHAYNANTKEVEAGGSEVQGHPLLPSKARLGCRRHCLKKRKEKVEAWKWISYRTGKEKDVENSTKD